MPALNPTPNQTVMLKSSLNLSTMNENEGDSEPLLKKLSMDPYEQQEFDPIPHQILRKYIMYANQNCDPVIGPDAADVLRSFYIHLRQTNQRSNGANPITMRQLESLTRLTQARAKVELRKQCSRLDACEVIEIMKASMVDYYEDELGILDFTRSQNGSGSSKSATIKQFVSILQKISNEKKTDLFNFDQIKEYYEVILLDFKRS